MPVGDSNVTLDNIINFRGIAWTQISDAYGNRAILSNLIPEQLGKLVVSGTSNPTLSNISNTQSGNVTAPNTTYGTSNVTLANISPLKEKAWVQISDAYGNRATSSVDVPSQTGYVVVLTTGTSSVTLAGISLAKEKAWVQIADAVGNRTTTSLDVPSQAGMVQVINTGTSAVTLGGITRNQTGTLFAGLSLVTLVEPLWLTAGSILDQSLWTGTAPTVGTQLYYQSSNGFTIAPNGAMSALVNEGSWQVYYQDVGEWYSVIVTFISSLVGTQNINLQPAAITQSGVVSVVGNGNVTLDSINPATSATSFSSGTQTAALAGVSYTQVGEVTVSGSSTTTLAALGSSFGEGSTGSPPSGGVSSITLEGITSSQSGSVIMSGYQNTTLDGLAITQNGSLVVSGVGNRTLYQVDTTQEGSLGPLPSTGQQALFLNDLTSVTSAGYSYSTGIQDVTLSAVTPSQSGAAYNDINNATQTVDLSGVVTLTYGFLGAATYIECSINVREVEDYVLSNSSTVIAASAFIVEVDDEIRERIYLDGGSVPSRLNKLKDFKIIGGK